MKHELDSGRSECFAFLTPAIFTCCQSSSIFFQSTAQSTSISFSVLFSHSPNHTPKTPGHPILAVSTRAVSSFPPVPAVPTLNPARRRDAKEEAGYRSANRADFRAPVGASMPDAVGVSSENIDIRYYSKGPKFLHYIYESFATCIVKCDPVSIYRSNVKGSDSSIGARIQVRTIRHTPAWRNSRPGRTLPPPHFSLVTLFAFRNKSG